MIYIYDKGKILYDLKYNITSKYENILTRKDIIGILFCFIFKNKSIGILLKLFKKLSKDI